jgi:hypothetical protein
VANAAAPRYFWARCAGDAGLLTGAGAGPERQAAAQAQPSQPATKRASVGGAPVGLTCSVARNTMPRCAPPSAVGLPSRVCVLPAPVWPCERASERARRARRQEGGRWWRRC